MTRHAPRLEFRGADAGAQIPQISNHALVRWMERAYGHDFRQERAAARRTYGMRDDATLLFYLTHVKKCPVSDWRADLALIAAPSLAAGLTNQVVEGHGVRLIFEDGILVTVLDAGMRWVERRRCASFSGGIHA
jgi:hypothetical protein